MRHIINLHVSLVKEEFPMDGANLQHLLAMALYMLAVIVIVAVVIVRRCVKKSRAKKAAKQAEAPQDEQK